MPERLHAPQQHCRLHRGAHQKEFPLLQSRTPTAESCATGTSTSTPLPRSHPPPPIRETKARCLWVFFVSCSAARCEVTASDLVDHAAIRSSQSQSGPSDSADLSSGSLLPTHVQLSARSIRIPMAAAAASRKMQAFFKFLCHCQGKMTERGNFFSPLPSTNPNTR